MNITRFLKPVIFIFECIRLIVIVVLLILQGNTPELFTNILLTAAGTLFPFMALFIWLDTDRYREYLPLFFAGKCISVFLLIGWLITTQQVTMIGKLFGFTVYTELAFLCGDLLILAAVFLIIKENKKPDTMEEK
jgi:hypothetical protein